MIYWQVSDYQHCVDMKLIPNLPTLGIKYKLYWIITSVAYILGLVATFISLFLMNSAQPALLYLVFIPRRILTNMMLRIMMQMMILKMRMIQGGFSDDDYNDVYLCPV